MNILTKTFTEHKKAATIGLISVAVVLSTGVGVACKGYVDNQAKLKKQAIENQHKMESEKIAKQKAEDEARAKEKAAAEEAAKLAAVSQPASEAAPAPAPTTKPTTTSTAKPKTTSETKPAPTGGDVSSISLVHYSGSYVKWQTSGYSDMGFKVVWSKTPGPTYPNRATDKYQYLSDPASYKTSISAFDGPGTYYVRVCEYLGGACGVYSNQITVGL